MMMPRVFLCEPSGLNATQRCISDQWHERLFGLGFDVDRLRSEDYESNPWSGLVGHIHQAQGVLVLGFGQLFVSAGTWRRGSEQERSLVATWTSPWLQLEAGIALGAGVPVLVARESGVCEGVFASETWTGPLRGTVADNPDEGVLEDWANAVARRACCNDLTSQ